MAKNYRKEEIELIRKIPAKILHQRLWQTECTVSMHWHKHVEIDLMLAGEAEFTVDGTKSLLAPGDFIIINSGDIHMGTARPEIPLKERHQELVTILWDYDFLHGYVDHLSALRFEMPQTNELRQMLRGLILEIDSAYTQKKLCFEMEITSALLQIGSILLRHCLVGEEKLPEGVSKKNLKVIQDAVHYIEKHYTANLTLEAIAQQTHLSPVYFSQKFKQLTGVTYHDYLVNCRVKNSLKDIRNTDLTITEIAYKNGFPNVKSFIAYFKKEYNTTPQKYRKAVEEDSRIV